MTRETWCVGAAQGHGQRDVQADAFHLSRDEVTGRLGIAVTDGIGDTDEAAFIAQLTAQVAATTAATATPELACVAAREQRTAHYAWQPSSSDERADASIVTALVDPHFSRVRFAWAGICRAYVLDTSGHLQRATYDHSLGEQLRIHARRRGPMSPFDRTLTRTVGSRREFVTTSLPVHTISAVLLCTDGISRHLDDQQIRNALLRKDARQAAKALASAADLKGHDNATAVVVHRSY